MANPKRIVRVLTLFMALVCSGAVFGEGPVAFIGGVVIDGNGGKPVDNGVVLVRDGRIEAVGEVAEVRVPTDARLIDLEGRAVLPGLADMHVHLMGGWDGVGSDWLGYQRYLNALLYSGVTTVFDLGNVMPFVLQLRDEVAAGTIAGPRIYCVGPLVDDADPSWPPFSVGLVIDSQVPDVVAMLERSGVDAVKAYGGLSVPLLRELVEVASESSLPVIADLWDRNGSYDLTATGIAALAHAPTHEIDQLSFDLIVEKMPVSISLGLWTTLIAYLVSIPLGVAKAVRDGSRFDVWTSGAVIFGNAIPGFLFAILLIVVFAGGRYFDWFPLRGLVSDDWGQLSWPMKIVDYFWHMTLPVLAMVIGGFAGLTMLTKNSFLDQINQQYVVTARAKGLGERAVLYGHVFRNAMLIVIAGFPSAFIGILFTSSLLIEVIFSLDGLGLLGFEAVIDRDYPIMFGSLYMFTLLGLILHLVGDITYMLIDPRIDFESREI